MHMPLAKKHAPGTMAGAPEENKTSFFGQAQTHGEQSAPPALVATSIPSANAQPANCGMEQWQEPKRMDMGGWSARTALQSATTGSYPPVASPQATTSGTSAQAAERQATEPKTVLERRRNETVSPYKHSMWAAELTRLGLYPKYPTVVDGLRDGFDLGIPYIFSTYVPPNNPSVTHLPDVYNSTINNEFAAGRYIGPFSRTEMEAEVGPFQTSPLSFIPKASKPDKYRAIHNFSFPHKPSPKATSINSHINSEDFPCTWGTFATITQLIAHLPPGSQASVRDVAEAYRTIPANPSQWPGLVIRLQNEDQYAVNVCNNFGLTSAGGVYGMVADAGTDIFRGNGIGPLAKWVDDHVFFRIPREHLPAYNLSRSKWSREIRLQGGCKQDGGRLWYKGKNRPDGIPEEFDEDCNFPFQDLAAASPRSAEDQKFSYADADIDALSGHLGICWEPSKSVPFGPKVPYLGFLWDLHARTVCLLEKKRLKYLAAIAEWEKKPTHTLLETQELHGKLQHASMVIYPGRAYVTNLEAMLASGHNRPFLPRTPPRDTANDLEWWKQRLSRPDRPRPIPEPRPLIDLKAYSDASSEFGIAITIGPRWRAWRLATGWESQGRDIMWAEAVGFELLVLCLLSSSQKGDHLTVYGDNRGVVEGWWNRSSHNKPTNRIFRRILQLSENCSRTIHTRYVPSAENPADPPSRGRYPPHELLLEDFNIPSELRPFLIGVGPC